MAKLPKSVIKGTPVERYPEIIGRPRFRNTVTNGKDYYQAEVSRKGGHRGHGHGPDKQTASDSAYVNSGGKVNPKGKFIYND
jgi:hypothetical protein